MGLITGGAQFLIASGFTRSPPRPIASATGLVGLAAGAPQPPGGDQSLTASGFTRSPPRPMASATGLGAATGGTTGGAWNLDPPGRKLSFSASILRCLTMGPPRSVPASALTGTFPTSPLTPGVMGRGAIVTPSPVIGSWATTSAASWGPKMPLR